MLIEIYRLSFTAMLNGWLKSCQAGHSRCECTRLSRNFVYPTGMQLQYLQIEKDLSHGVYSGRPSTLNFLPGTVR
jgi:hypothetical protein